MNTAPSLFPELSETPKGSKKTGHVPLAERLRPTTLSDVLGQPHLVGEEGILSQMLSSGHCESIILWGPPGCGKTTIARLLADATDHVFETVSAVVSGVSALRSIFEKTEMRHQQGQGTLLMVDEIHRFNRAQQDVFLPYVESGVITLVGATTENPSFELNSALLSRCRVITLKRLDEETLTQLLMRAQSHYDTPITLTDDVKSTLCHMADGDGRYLLSLYESLQTLVPEGEKITQDNLSHYLQARAPLYDKSRDEHYNIISALHKSLRGSDPDAALYWMARMLAGGEDPNYITRRLVRFATEDIGLADPHAITQALAAKDAYQFLGSPEGELAIAQAVIYLACAPKSNANYQAYKQVTKDVRQTGSLMPPMHILNAPTALMKEQGYHEGYIYDHDTEHAFSGQDYFPDSLERRNYYSPVERGFEREIKKRLDYWSKLREKQT